MNNFNKEQKLLQTLIFAIYLAAMIVFSACGSESETDTTVNPIAFEVETSSELGKCSYELEGISVYVKNESSDYICTKEIWVKENEDGSFSLSSVSYVFSSSSLHLSSSAILSYSSSFEEMPCLSSSAKSSSSSLEKLSSKGNSSSSSKMKGAWLYLNPNISYGEFKDGRDGQIYKTVKIGDQVWMAENLNYDYNTGSVKSTCYQNSADSCFKYGKLYTWEAAKTACPKGWHLPTKDEWRALIIYAGDSIDAKTKLKSTSGWENTAANAYGNGTDDFGFSLLPGGFFEVLNEDFFPSGYYTSLWCAGEEYEDADGRHYACDLFIGEYKYVVVGHQRTENYQSVRCVEGAAPQIISSSSSAQSSSSSNVSWNFNPDIDYGELKDMRDGQVYKTVQIGDQVWMAENLNFNYNESNTAASYCYNNSADSCAKYGRLYTWVAAMKACPDEWHLPTEKEWKTLSTYKNESCGNSGCFISHGWQYQGGTDIYGFSIIPAGEQVSGKFRNIGKTARFWLGTDKYPNHAKYVEVTSIGNYDQYKNNAYSVRCIKGTKQTSNPREPIPLDYMTDPRDGQIYPIVTIGTQTWMAKNLNYENRDKEKEHFYWKSANSSCPVGWHLPSYAEWDTLIEYVEGDGSKLKDIGSWDAYCFKGSDCSGTDDYMFSVQPTEYNWGSNRAVFWTSTKENSNSAYVSLVREGVDIIGMNLENNITGLCASVRCIKDAD